MYKDGILQFKWYEGIGLNPITGNADIVNAEIFEMSPAVKVANPYLNDGKTYTSLPVAHQKDVYGNEYVLTTGGTLYKNGSSLATSLGIGYDLKIFKDHLFVTHSASVSVYGPLNSGPSWNLNVYTGLEAGYYHKMIVDENPDASLGAEAIYITNKNNIQTIRAFVSLSSIGTMSTGLTLPTGIYAKTMAQLGGYLMIGTFSEGGNVANIYPWSKSNTESFNRPVMLNENGVKAMISDNNKLIVLAGDKGNLYFSDSANYTLVKRLPWVQNRQIVQNLEIYPNAIAINQQGNLLVGTSSATDPFSDNPSGVQHGIFEIDLRNYYTTRNTPAHKASGVTQTAKIGFIAVSGIDSEIIGWQNGSTYGVDSISAPGTNTAILTSPLIRVSGRLQRKTFQKIEFNLMKPLVAGQSIKVYYRKNLDEDFNLAKTFTYTNLGGISTHSDSALMSDIDQIQVKVELIQSGVAIYENIILTNLIIW